MLSQIHPAEASAEISAIYDDISAVSGVPMVNLIWRHFASLPGVLPWVWEAVRPLVGSAEMALAQVRVEGAVQIPLLTKRGSAAWRQAGVTDSQLADFRALIAAYERGNLINIIALTAFRLRLDRPNEQAARFTLGREPPSTLPLPPLPKVEFLSNDLADKIRALADMHDGTRDGTIPSLYLALAAWPVVLAALPEWLEPLYAPGAMQAARQSAVRVVGAEAASLLPVIGPLPEAHFVMRPALDRFTTLIIPDLIPVCIALRHLLPEC